MAVLATGAILMPDSLADAPGSLGKIELTFAGLDGGYDTGLGVLSSPGSSEWRFGNQPRPDSTVTPTRFKIQVSKYKGVTVNYTPFAYCAEISKLITQAFPPVVEYELIPLSSIGYYSRQPTVLPEAADIFDNGIGTEKAKLVQGLADTRYYQSSVDPGASDITKAAFQLALWKIVSEDIGAPDPGVIGDGDWDFNQTVGGSGTGLADGIIQDYPGSGDYLTLMTTAQSYLDAAIAEASNPGANHILITAVTTVTTGASPDYYEQDLLLFGPIPEPQTYAIVAGLGLVGFGLYRRMGRKA
mgnify:CR=1 FL=1